MARTSIPVNNLASNGILLNDAGTAIDATNNHVIDLKSGAIPAGAGPDRLILYVKNSTGSTKTVTVKAGDNPPSFRAGLGDLTTGNINATTGTAVIGPFDPARFLQDDGTILLDVASGMTGTIWAFLLTRVP